jgi:Ca2+-binding RTX toxin-like protein
LDWVDRHSSFGPDINSEGQLGYEIGGRLFSYAEYGSAAKAAVDPADGFEQSVHFLNVPLIGPAVEISRTGSEYWQSAGSVETAGGELAVETLESDVSGAVFGFPVGTDQSGAAIRATGADGSEISLTGTDEQRGLLTGDGSDTYATLQPWKTLEPSTVAELAVGQLEEPGDSVRGSMTTEVTADGDRFVYLNTFAEGANANPLSPPPGQRYVLDLEAGTYIQRAQPAVGDRDFLMRPAATGEFELPDDGESDAGDPIAGSDPGGAEAEQVSSSDSETTLTPGQGDHPAGEAHREQIGSDAPSGGTADPDPGALAGGSPPSESIRQAMVDAWEESESSPAESANPNANRGEDNSSFDGTGRKRSAEEGGAANGPAWSYDGTPEADYAAIDFSDLPDDAGAHPAGPSVDQTIDNDGTDRPQGDRTGEAVSPDGDAPELETGQGEHAAGDAHETQSEETQTQTGSGAAAVGFGALGRALASESGIDGTGETAAVSTVAGTLGQNLGQEIGEGTGFEDFGSDLSANARGTATGLVAGEVTADLAESLGFDGNGFGDQLGVRMTQYAVSSTIDAGVNAATSSDSLGSSLGESFNGGTLANVAGGFVGGYLASEFLDDSSFSADTQTGATVGAVGGAVGTAVGAQLGAEIGTGFMPVIGTIIGAFVGAVFGTVLGSVFGDLFGSEPAPPPEAEATLSYSVADGFQVSGASDAHGGNGGGMASAAQQAGEVLNALIEATGGRLKDPEAVDALTIGYSGEHMTVNGRVVGDTAEGVEALIEEALAGQAIEGGDAFIKRALYQQIEAGETGAAELVEVLTAARRYSAANEDSERLGRLREDPEVQAELEQLDEGEITTEDLSDEALQLHRAVEALADGEALGLDEAHRFDEASRLNDRFAEQDIDLEGVALEDLVVHQQEGRLVVGIRDAEQPEAAVGSLPHAAVEAYAGDFAAARLYLDGREHDLADVLDRVGADATSGPVHIGTALANRYAGEDAAVHTGTHGRDTLVGTDGDDIIAGWEGGDVLEGGAGDDRLLSGAGRDTLNGGSGEDTADYRDSGDSVAVDLASGEGLGGHADGDRLEDIEHLAGSGHADELRGGDGDNTLAGRDGNDRLIGEGGDDTLDGGAGDDIMAGGSGDDRISGGSGDDIAAGGEGDDFLMGGRGGVRLDGGAGHDTVVGGEGDDILAGGRGRDTLDGGAGDDILMGATDGDRLDGGSGDDIAVYAGSWDDYRVDLVDGELQVSAIEGDAPGDRLADIETIAFDEHTFQVEALREILEAQNEADEDERNRRLTGSPTAGTTSLGDAAALGVIGWIAADAAVASDESADGFVLVDDADGDVRVPAEAVSERTTRDAPGLLVADEAGVVVAHPRDHGARERFGDGGGDGSGDHGDGGGVSGGVGGQVSGVITSDPAAVSQDTVDAASTGDGSDSSADDAVSKDAVDDAAEDSEASVDDEASFILYGTSGDDRLVDHYDVGVLIGFAGDDVLVGRGGDDDLRGGPGDDVLLPGTGTDEVDGGDGADTVSYRDVEDGVTVDLAGDAGRAGAADGDEFQSIEHAEGSPHADRLIADPEGSRLYGLVGDDELVGDGGRDLLAGGAGDDRLAGAEGADTLNGGAGADELRGGAGDDTLGGGGGADRLTGGAGADVLAGGEGDDRLEGGTGDDRLSGDAGNDRLLGGAGRDELYGGDGDDRLSGGTGDDRLAGGDGDDVLEGGEGVDTLSGDAGNDRLDGGADVDALYGGSGDDILRGGEGDDRTLDGGAGDDRIHGDAGDDVLRGGEGDDRLLGGSGDDDLLGGSGDDTLEGGAGADTFNGQAGDDLMRVDAEDDLGFVDGGAGRDTVELTEARAGAVNLAALSSVEVARGSGDNDTLNGTFALDRIEGGGGDDRVRFADLSVFDVDAFDWSEDRDELTIRRDDEAVTVAAETVVFAEDDVALGGEDNAPFIADGSLEGLRTDEDVPLRFTREGLDIEVLDVDTGETAGSERITAVGGIDFELSRALGDDYDSGYPGPGREMDTAIGDVTSYSIEQQPRGGNYLEFESRFTGTGGDDNLFGSEPFPHPINVDPKSGNTSVTLPGPKGGSYYQARNIDAADGDDVLRAFGGDDILVGGAGADVLRGGGGNDTVDYSRSGGSIDVDLATGTGSGGTASGDTLYSIENVIGTGGADDLAGDAGGNILEGLTGNDTIIGHDGDDRLYGGRGSDEIEGGRGDDRLHGGRGNDLLSGGAGDDTLIGGRGGRDVAVFSGTRDEYAVESADDHLIVEHTENGESDRIYGIQALRFDDQSLFIDEADARNGTLSVRNADVVFQPDPDFNSIGGQTGDFTVSVGDGGSLASTMVEVEVEVDEINDRPEMLPDAVDYEPIGALTPAESVRDGLFVRSEVENTNGVTRFEWNPVDPGLLGQDQKAAIADALGSNVDIDDLEPGSEHPYQTVDRTGSVNAGDPDGLDHELEFELLDDAHPGYVDLESDGSFRYRLNTGAEQPRDPAITGSIVTREAVPGRPGQAEQPAESTRYALHDLENIPEGDPTARGQQASFTVRITDSGEGESNPESIEYEANIVSKHSPDDDGGLFGGLFPVVLDLDGDGLDFAAVEESNVLADADRDGDPEKVAWMSGTDGLVMLDRDGNGRFSSMDEISFVDDHPDARTDMEGLALAFDSNENGRLDAGDERWDDFYVWQDADGDGTSDSGELRTLTEQGIESIGVVSDGRGETAADGDVTIFGRSEFTRTDGSTGTAGDVAFATHPADVDVRGMENDVEPSAESGEWVAMLAQRLVQAQAIPTDEKEEDPVVVDDAALAAAMSGSDAFDMATESG